jgi:vitamin B12 transporter
LTTFFPPATAPTADLQPEEAEGWDAALVSEAFGGKLSAEIGVFSLRTDNLINFSGGRFVNIARAKSEGVEAAASLEPTPGLRLSISYTYNDAIDETTGRPLPRVPDNAAFLEADWQAAERLGLSLTVRYNGKESDAIRLRNPDGVIPDWTRIDLAARYRIGEHAELFGRIENLADEAYQDIFGFGEPGRSVYAGVRVKLE